MYSQFFRNCRMDIGFFEIEYFSVVQKRVRNFYSMPFYIPLCFVMNYWLLFFTEVFLSLKKNT
jgi:hypothetical protein